MRLHWRDLLEEVIRDNVTIVITRWGKPIARLSPYDTPEPTASESAPAEMGAPSLGLADRIPAQMYSPDESGTASAWTECEIDRKASGQ